MAVKYIKGATLIESLTALAIVTTVMGAAFTLYDKTVSRQQMVMKTRAKCIQTEFESVLFSGNTPADMSNDMVNVEVTTGPYQNDPETIHYNLLIQDKQGKIIMEKNYLVNLPSK